MMSLPFSPITPSADDYDFASLPPPRLRLRCIDYATFLIFAAFAFYCRRHFRRRHFRRHRLPPAYGMLSFIVFHAMPCFIAAIC